EQPDDVLEKLVRHLPGGPQQRQVELLVERVLLRPLELDLQAGPPGRRFGGEQLAGAHLQGAGQVFDEREPRLPFAVFDQREERRLLAHELPELVERQVPRPSQVPQPLPKDKRVNPVDHVTTFMKILGIEIFSQFYHVKDPHNLPITILSVTFRQKPRAGGTKWGVTRASRSSMQRVIATGRSSATRRSPSSLPCSESSASSAAAC